MSLRESAHAPTPATAFQRRTELALDTACIGTWEWDPVADHVSWSPRFEELHGFPPGAFGTSLAFYALNIHPEDRDRVGAALRGCAEGGADYRVEYRLISLDGTVHHVAANGCQIVDEHGRKRLLGVCQDISERVELLASERRARRAAEQSDMHYRMLADTIPPQVWTATPEGALDFVNRRTVEYFGRSSDEIVGAGWQDVIHASDLPPVVECWQRSLATGVEYEVEFRLRRQDGQYRWHLGRAVPLRDSSGAIVRWLGTNTDIDERKRMLALTATQVTIAHLLVRSRSLETVAVPLLEAICRNLGWDCAQLWIVDRKADVLVRNGGWCNPARPSLTLDRLAEVDRMARGVGLPGRIWQSKEPAWIEDVRADANFPRAQLLTSLELRSAVGFPLIVSGEVAAVLELFSGDCRAPDESTTEMMATFANQIGEFVQRIVAENELSDALHRLRRLQNLTDVALAHLSQSELFDNLLSRICEAVSCDASVVWLLEPKTQELYPAATSGAIKLPSDVRMGMGESLGGAAAAERRTMIVRAATSQSFIHPDLRALGLESVVAVPLMNKDRLVGVLVVGRFADRPFTPDEVGFTELVGQRLANAVVNAALYEDARNSNRIKDRFLSIASHELKTPITGILGWAALLKQEVNPKLRAEAVAAIEQSARMQARLIEDFLDVARIREGKLLLRKYPVNLVDVFNVALRVVSSAAEQRGVIVQSTALEPELIVHGDTVRLQQVVCNLLNNAIKFTSAGKCVRATITRDRSDATIMIEDEGMGIDPDFLSRIFDPFEQEEQGKAAGGLGLGLHIVSTIVKLHGGTIEARSDGTGKGAKFLVRLPLHKASTENPVA